MGLLDDVRRATADADAERAKRRRLLDQEAADKLLQLPRPRRSAWGIELAQAFKDAGVPTIPLIESSPFATGENEPERGWGMCTVTLFISNMPVTSRQRSYDYRALSVTGRSWSPARYSIDVEKPRDGVPAEMHVAYEDEYRTGGDVSREVLLAWAKVALRRQEENWNAEWEGVLIGTRKVYDHDDPWG